MFSDKNAIFAALKVGKVAEITGKRVGKAPFLGLKLVGKVP